MDDYPAKKTICKRYDLLRPFLDERLRRLWVAAEAVSLGPGGIAALSTATGLSRSTIRTGIKQLKEWRDEGLGSTMTGRVRKPGAGRKSAVQKGSGIEEDLERLIESREAK